MRTKNKMKMLYYEMRKCIFRKYMIVFFAFAIIINYSFFIMDSEKPSLMSEGISKNTVSEEQWNVFIENHKEFDGEINQGKIKKIIEYKSKYSEGSAEIYKACFYNQLKYICDYRDWSNEQVNKAKQRENYYKKLNNSYEVSRNKFIIDKYSNRNINYFLNSEGWRSLFKFDYSDLIIFVLIILVMIPNFRNERLNNMNDILATVKNRNCVLFFNKKLVILCWNIFLNIFFAIYNYIIFSSQCGGMNNSFVNLYCIQEYKFTTLNISLFGFYLLIVLCKIIAFFIMTEIMFILCKKINNIYILYSSVVLLFIVMLYVSGYIVSPSFKENIIALFSPLTFTKINIICKNCTGFNVFNKFYSKLFVYFLIQICIVGILEVISFRLQLGKLSENVIARRKCEDL